MLFATSDGLLGFMLVLMALTYWEVMSLRKKVASLETLQRQLNKIAVHLNVDMGEATPGGVMELIQAGQKISAIKAYREKTGAGLAEAKKAVEDLATEAGIHI